MGAPVGGWGGGLAQLSTGAGRRRRDSRPTRPAPRARRGPPRSCMRAYAKALADFSGWLAAAAALGPWAMVDPVRTLVGTLERELASVPDARLHPGAGTEATARFRAIFGSDPPPGL